VALPDFLAPLEAVLTSMEEGAARLTEAITNVQDVPSLFLNLFVVALVPAIGEEMIFRGLVLPILHKWTGKIHAAVWISAILFSGMHLQFYGFLPRLVLGGLLGYLFVYTRSLWAPIIAHFVNNGLALVLLFFMARGEIGTEVDSFEPELASFIAAGVSVFIAVGVLVYMSRHKPIAASDQDAIEAEEGA
jgi:membrane protease YdiL (CAAX protease family)